MDPGNMNRFFYAEKPGSPWHEYTRHPDQEAPWFLSYPFRRSDPSQDDPVDCAQYPDLEDFFKDTAENFPWLHDQDPSRHFRMNQPYIKRDPSLQEPAFDHSRSALLIFISDYPAEKIYLDSPVAPEGWREVQQPTTPAQ